MELTPAELAEQKAQAEDTALVKTIDYLMDRAAKGDKTALETAGRFMSMAELRGGDVMGRLERLADQKKAEPVTEPSERDLELLDGVLQEYTQLPVVDLVERQQDFPENDFDPAQHAGLRRWTSSQLSEKRAQRRLEEIRRSM